ncbi:OX-2 membrane glycoprotein-like [Cyprinodon tularosa]|uniref:OX-2 membrane glycoprotein-like n=1 Tax=Cyprinodon tularosa TaxID=77115 RepID=UPI0018E27B3F|nr:OX-2 membrane glycoprotein-like [Cyprinodon tularosa]
MPHGRNLWLILFLFTFGGAFQKDVAAVIQTQQTVLAAEGEDAPLSCQLLETKEVHQVTWQKVFGNKKINICSYSEYFGQTVNPGFEEKVQFTEAGLQKSSIVFRNVTEQDEGCYLCLFNTFPDGALTGTTCLKVYELHEPILDMRRSNVSAESVVSCSATGRPAPTVTLTVLQQNLSFSHYDSSSVTHSNGTVTVTTTALLSAFSSTQVGCSVSVLSAAPRVKLITVPGFTETSDDGLVEDSGPDHSVIGWIVGVLAIGVLVALLAIFWFRRKNQSRKHQKEKNSKEQISVIQNEEIFVPQKNIEEQTSVLINRQTSKSPTTKYPITLDVESSPHPILTGKKSS